MIKLNPGLNDYSEIINKQEIHFKCKYVPQSTEVLIFFHGLACSWDTFRNVLDHDYFPDKTLLLLDHIGFGDSSKNEDFSYAMKDQAKVIDELITVLPHWNIHIVAHSMGGAIALMLGKDTFSKILSFTNIEGNLIGDDCGIMSRKIADMSFEEYKKELYKYHLFAFKRHEQMRFNQSSAYAIYHSAISLVKESDDGELLEKFRALDCHKSYFYGDENTEMPVLKKLDFVTKSLINKSGHAMTTENPEEFYKKLVEFIGSVGSN